MATKEAARPGKKSPAARLAELDRADKAIGIAGKLKPEPAERWLSRLAEADRLASFGVKRMPDEPAEGMRAAAGEGADAKPAQKALAELASAEKATGFGKKLEPASAAKRLDGMARADAATGFAEKALERESYALKLAKLVARAERMGPAGVENESRELLGNAAAWAATGFLSFAAGSALFLSEGAHFAGAALPGLQQLAVLGACALAFTLAAISGSEASGMFAESRALGRAAGIARERAAGSEGPGI
jgi:hypothetical protein